jgi:hypothetical protein
VRSHSKLYFRHLNNPYQNYLLTRQAMYYKRSTETRSCNHCCRRKAASVTYSECVSVSLVIQRAMHLRLTMLSSVPCLHLQYFSALSHKRHDFREKLLNIKCVFWFFYNICRDPVPTNPGPGLFSYTGHSPKISWKNQTYIDPRRGMRTDMMWCILVLDFRKQLMRFEFVFALREISSQI